MNWGNVGTTLGGVVTAIANAGVQPGSSAWHSILASIGLASNPNQSEEMALCSSIMVAQGNPMLVSALSTKLATEQGIPAAAATLAMTLAAPGTNIAQVVIEIETIIRNGG
jgi:hypothetical protein